MSLDTEVEQKIRQGIYLARENKRPEAEQLFAEVLAVQPHNETALIWKAAVSQSPAEAVRCLEQALQLNPTNQKARAGLEWAQRRLQNQKVTQFPGTLSENGSAHKAEQRYDEVTPTISVKPPSSPPPAAKIAPNSEVKAAQPLNEAVPSPKATQEANPAFETVSKGSNRNPAAAEPSNPLPKAKSAKVEAAFETLDATPPYKKSRFKTAQNHTLKPSDSDLPAIAQPRPRRNTFQFGRGARRKQAFQAATVSVSKKVQEQHDFDPASAYFATNRVKLVVPLSLFLAAVVLSLATLPLAALALPLGVLAVAVALVGVVLFNRAEF